MIACEIEIGDRYAYSASPRNTLVLEVTSVDETTVGYAIISDTAHPRVYRGYRVARADFVKYLEKCREIPR